MVYMAKYGQRSCLQCQKFKVYHHTVILLGTFSLPAFCFSNIHLDTFKWLYMYLNHHWQIYHTPEAVPISDISAETTAKTFVKRWIAIFGVSAFIATDRGSWFEANGFSNVYQKYLIIYIIFGNNYWTHVPTVVGWVPWYLKTQVCCEVIECLPINITSCVISWGITVKSS